MNIMQTLASVLRRFFTLYKIILDLRYYVYDYRKEFVHTGLQLICIFNTERFIKNSDSLIYLKKCYFDHLNSFLGLPPSQFNLNISMLDFIDKYISFFHSTCSYNISSLIPLSYKPINWHADIRVNVRWPINRIHYNQHRRKFGNLKSDFKLPWELSRFNHVTRIVFNIVEDDDVSLYAYEFKYQVLDFIATNPIGMGINWTCSMDIAIRVSNWIMCYNYFQKYQLKNIFDDTFNSIFVNSLYNQGKFIFTHLEYRKSSRNNHYLSNIAGLLFISASLEPSKETNKWLMFSIQELINELKNQFHNEGTDFEGSTSYHQLSSEILLYSFSLIIGLENKQVYRLINVKRSCVLLLENSFVESLDKQEFFIDNGKIILPDFVFDVLFKAAEFTYYLTNNNGHIPAIGDHDSGRFFKFSVSGNLVSLNERKLKYLNLSSAPSFGSQYFDEDELDFRPLLSAFSGLFDDPRFDMSFPLEKSIIQFLSGGKIIHRKPSVFSFKLTKKTLPVLPYSKKHRIKSSCFLLKNLEFISYNDFGLYILKSDTLHLTFSAVKNGQNGKGGHAHNDKSALTLTINDQEILQDPGTYVYTRFPELRNQFRSTKYHNCPYVDNVEQNDFNGLFGLKEDAHCFLSDKTNRSLTICVMYKSVVQTRKVIIYDRYIDIEDNCNYPFKVKFNSEFVSKGYGKLESSYKYPNILLLSDDP